MLIKSNISDFSLQVNVWEKKKNEKQKRNKRKKKSLQAPAPAPNLAIMIHCCIPRGNEKIRNSI